MHITTGDYSIKDIISLLTGSALAGDRFQFFYEENGDNFSILCEILGDDGEKYEYRVIDVYHSRLPFMRAKNHAINWQSSAAESGIIEFTKIMKTGEIVKIAKRYVNRQMYIGSTKVVRV